MKTTILGRKLEMPEDDLTPTNQRIINLDIETGQPIDELIATDMETATTTGTVLGETRETGSGTQIAGRGTTERGQGHKNDQATIIALALRPPSVEGAQKVLPDHHHQGR